MSATNEQLILRVETILADVKFFGYAWDVRESHGVGWGHWRRDR